MIENENFDEMVTNSVNLLPEGIRSKIRNVAFIVDDVRLGNLLGQYHGVPNTAKPIYLTVLPDTITVFKRTIEAEAAANGEELSRLVRRVVWHEIGHYLGFGEKRIRELEKKWAKEGRI